MRRGRRRTGIEAAVVALRAAPSPEATAAALQQSTTPEEEDLREIFEEASGGKDMVSFDEATRLEGVDGILEEGATTLKELQLLWGDDSVALNFKDWCKWYLQVLKLYDEFLWKDAVAPPSDLLADVEEELEDEDRDYTDEELLEDQPTQNQVLSEVVRRTAAARAEAEATRQAGGAAAAEKASAIASASAAGPGRENLEITRLFREGCDDQNLLSFEALLEISEISGMIREGDITKDELREMWAELPATGDSIDVLTFKDLMSRIDDLFEYEDEEEAQEEEKGEASVVPVKRDPILVKSELQTLISNLEEVETKPCGLDGREETDASVTKLTSELEQLWRDRLGDLEDFDESSLVGDWELVYSTSAKYRRWQSILNTDKYIKGGQLDGLTQSFAVEPSTVTREYDMEEIFLLGENELGMRAVGSWSVALQSNVVTGDDDLVLKLNLNSVEYDTEDEEVEQAEKKLLQSQMVRTFCYSFIAYMDDEVRIMRTGLTGNSIFVYQRMQDGESETV